MSFEAADTATQNRTPAGTAQPLSAQNDYLQKDEIKQKKTDNGFPILQPKLTVGAPDDPFEKEADSVADKVMRMPEQSFIQRKCAACEDEERVQRKPEEAGHVRLKRNLSKNFIQRKCAECEKEEKEKIHRKPLSESIASFIQAKSESGVSVNSSAAKSIESSKGSGSSLDGSTHSFMSGRFGSDFSNVKIHTDNEAIQLSRDLNAKAFTTGNDVYFNDGQYQPNSTNGKQLLAHELTHVVQQSNGVKRYAIQRRPSADEDQLHVDEGLDYRKAIKANLDGWDLMYRFYSIFLRKNIFPGSQPNAYANHVFEIQQFFKKTYPKQWTLHSADGILDTLTLNYLLSWSEDYGKNKTDTSRYEGLDTDVLERLATIKPTHNPPLRSSYLKDVFQFQLINDYGFATELGSKGDFVTKLQNALVYLHYPIGSKEMGVRFGEETKAAVESFQRDSGYEGKSVDGRLGQHTLRLLDTLLANKGSILLLPGMVPYIEGFLSNGLEMYIDGDGDQRKELRLKFTAKGGKVNVSVTHIDTKETKGPFAFAFTNLDLSKEVTIVQTAMTEGFSASKIKLSTQKDDKAAPGPDNIIEIFPPKKIKTDGSYNFKANNETYTAAFDVSKMTFNKVISSEIVVEPANISAEVKLGVFNDTFRFTLVKDDSKEDTDLDEDGNGAAYHYLLKIAGIGTQGEMVFADDVPFTLQESRLEQLVFNDMEKDETSVTYDFDGDTKADVKVNTTLTQAFDPQRGDKNIPATGRYITIVLTGPALEKQTQRGFKIFNGKFQFTEKKTEAVFEGIISAEGGKVLKELELPSGINDEIKGIDAALEQFYQQAAKDEVINKETYVAYRIVKEGIKNIASVTKRKEAELTDDDKRQITQLALYADAFYNLFKTETKDARRETQSAATEMNSSDTTTNPFTQESETTDYVPLTTPTTTKSELHLGDEIRAHQWSGMLATFNRLRTGYNLWVSEKVKEKKPEKDNKSGQISGFFQYQMGLEEIANDPNNKYITRVKAIYYSWEQFKNEPRAKSIELPMYYYLNEDDNKWWLIDFVRPDHPFKRKAAVNDANKNIVRNDGKTPAPPQELFDKLNDKEHLPKGVLLYDAGMGRSGRIDMTEPWEWKDILGWIGLGLAAIGLAALVVLSEGAATPVAAEIFFALSAVAGGTAAALDIYKMYKDEEWSAKKVVMDVGQIAASMLTLGTLSAGRLVVIAREADPAARLTGTWAKLASLADTMYVPMIKMTIGTDLINFGLLTKDTFDKFAEIDQQQGLDDATRTRTKIFLLSQLLFAGGMTFLSLRGNVRGLDHSPTLVLHPGPDGVPMISDARVWLPENVHAPDLLQKITTIAEQRKFPVTPNEYGLNNLESLLKGVQSDAFGQSKNAVPALETLLSNSGEFEKTARAVAYCNKNGFTHFDVVYEGILNIPDNRLNTVKTNLLTLLAENPGFTLKLSDDEIRAVIQKGKSLSLSDEEINDFLLISSREKKSIIATELMTQMDNWKMIQQRGFPYLFSDMKTFTNFKMEVKKLLVKYGIPAGDIKVQGSSLRTSAAKDIDMAVFVSDSEFDAMAIKLREGIVSRTATNPKLRKSLLQQLDNGIQEGRINSFLFDRLPSSTQSFNQELYELNKFLSETGKGFDLSVMKTSGKFVLSPALNF